MKKKLVAFMLASCLMCQGISVYASGGSDSMKITVGQTGASITSDSSSEIDYEEQYAYSGKDYVYAKVTFGKKEYAINRSDFGSLMSTAYQYGTPEENFVAYRESEEIEDVEAVVNPEPVLEKDEETPWDYWTQEDWDIYDEWAKDFVPTEYQQELLSEYSLVQLFCYYYDFGYYIDENAFWEYRSAKEKYDNEKESTTSSKTTSQTDSKSNSKSSSVTEVKYTKMTIAYELDSMYDRTMVFCITADDMSGLSDSLNNYPLWTGDEDIKNPNAYKAGKYFFEIGTADRHISDIADVEKSVGAKAYKYAKGKKVKMDVEDLAFVDSSEEYYRIRICTLQGKKPASNEFIITKTTAMMLLSNYLPNDTESPAKEKTGEIADGTKG